MRGDDFGFTALRVAGGLLPAEFLAKVAALEAGDQDNAAYGLTKSLSLRDEIGRSWRIAGDLWGGLRGQGTHVWLPAFLAQVLAFSDLHLVGSPIVLGERRYPLTHRACRGSVAIALVPSSCDLDRSDAAFGEDGRRRTPFWLVQEYLNAADEAAWGIVANGTLLRVLRDNPSLTRTAYIEIDLERMFEDQIFADFAAFWLLAHASRFQPRDQGKPTSCIFERWRERALETGERFRDLRKGVTEALLTLGQGFLAHPANNDLRAALTSGRLDAAGLHQQLLRLVYRLLFLFTIEDRGLLHPPEATDGAKALYRDGYGAGQLRTRSLRSLAYDRHGDLWQGLGITFLALERGAPEIAAPALGGLFDRGQCPDLFAARLANADLLAAVKALAFFRSGKALARVNYRDMNTEEFGSVYESLLELHPFIEAARWRFGYFGINGEVAKSAERKETGSYYTKPILVQELIKLALDPLMRETVSAHPYDQRPALLNIKILDPACGSGHFLLASSRRLATAVARLDAFPDPPTEAQHQHALREVVRHCIYGVDKNPLAVELCKTVLWIETVESGKPLSFLDHHIKIGDSVIGVFDLKVLENGIPDDAYKAKADDDKAVARDLRARNSKEQTMLTLDLAPDQECRPWRTARRPPAPVVASGTPRQAKRKELQRAFVSMLARAKEDERATLFVEGEDDVAIVTAAWSVLFEREPLPFKVLGAGGTTQLKGLAVPEKSFRDLLEDRLVAVLCDNDGEARALWNEGHLHKGGRCKRQTNGVWWCLLQPTGEFRAVMSRFTIDAAFWPFTIENAFPAALRRLAMAEGAYALDTAPMADLLSEQRISKPIVQALATLPEDDPAQLYLRRPTPEAKHRFAAWVTALERLTAANYAAFTPVLTSLKHLLECHTAETAAV